MTGPSPILVARAASTYCIAAAFMAASRPSSAGAQMRHADLLRQTTYTAPDSVDLSSVRDCRLSPAGELFLTVRGMPFLLVFDDEGSLVRTVGRAGDGPGEFREPAQFGWVGDTLWVSDFLHRRVTLFDARGGALLGTVPWPALRSRRRAVPARVFAVLADGSLLAVEEVIRLDFRTRGTTTLPLLRAASNDSVADTTALLYWATARLVVPNPTGSGGLDVRQPWADSDLWAVGPGGRSVFVVSRRAAGTAKKAVYAVRAVGPRGEVLSERARTYTPVPLPRAVIEREVSEISRYTRMFPSPGAARAAIRQALFAPPFYPPVSSVFAASDGTVWLEREQRGRERMWDVVGPDGEVMQVSVTAGTRLLEARGRQAWGIVGEDEGAVLVRFQVRSRR